MQAVLDSDEVKQYLQLAQLREAMFFVAGELALTSITWADGPRLPPAETRRRFRPHASP